MAITLNRSCNAASLISQGKISTGSWDESKVARTKANKSAFLAIDDSKPDDTEGHYKYPVIADGMVSRKGLASAEGYANTSGASSVAAEAKRLAMEADKKLAGKKAKSQVESAGGTMDEYDSDANTYALDSNGIATVNIHGPMTKNASVFTRYFGGTAMSDVMCQLDAAADDPMCKAVMLHIDSPGGQSMGAPELAAKVRNFPKPILAYIDGMGASAAYLAASGADKIIGAPTSMVGSIGTMMVVADSSKAASKAGIKVHAITSGGVKGAGTPGTPITKDQMEAYQKLVNDINEHFINGVADGRKMNSTDVRNLADGRIHVGSNAVANKLIDAVGSESYARHQLQSMMPIENLAGLRQQYPDLMAAFEAEVVARESKAGADTLKAAQTKAFDDGVASERERVKLLSDCQTFKADAKFVLEQVQNGNELGKAKQAYADVVIARNAELEKQLKAQADRQALADAAHTQSNGNVTIPLPASQTNVDAVVKFNTRVEELVKSGMKRDKAVLQISVQEKDLYQAMLEQANSRK